MFNRKKQNPNTPLIPDRRGSQNYTQKRTTQKRKTKVTRPAQGYVRAAAQPLPTGRIIFAMVILCALFLAMASRLVWMSQVPAVEPRSTLRAMPQKPEHRGDIYDASGILLATTLKSYSLFADPARMLNPKEDLQRLATILPRLNTPKNQKKLSNKSRRFVWLQRRLQPDIAHKINALGIPGLAFRTENVRVYPHKNLLSHVLGATNVDGNGLAGVERSQNKILAASQDVHLTLRVDLQQQLHHSLTTAMQRSEAKAAWGVVTNPQTGAILALTLGVYEMGSTFKLFALAQGLDAGTITPETEIDATNPIKVGRFTIKDFHAKKRVLTATEVMRYSSNIGAAKIADELGPEHQKEFMQRLGFLSPINVGIPEVGRPIFPQWWRRIQTLTISFGHGIAVTPMHLVAAVGALVTDGHKRSISVLKTAVQPEPTQIIAPETVSQIRTLMADVVANGSGRNSKVLGLNSGGKTGTAEKVGRSGYSETRNLVSFISAAPLNNPELLTLIMLDEPKKAYATGGRIAAPAVRDFQTRALPLLNLIPTPAELTQKRTKTPKGTPPTLKPLWPVYQ